MTSHDLLIGQRAFPTKTAARDAVRVILNATVPGGELADADFHFIGALLGRHPEAVDKIGVGIEAITVRPATSGTRCFWVRRVDGTEVDFSYLTAIDGVARSPKEEVCAALREEVDRQTGDYRKDHHRADATCAICAEALGDADVHVDHEHPTFDMLATTFAAQIGGWEAIAVECVGPYGRRLRDREAGEQWQRYHHQHARLRLVHANCNRTRRRTVS